VDDLRSAVHGRPAVPVGVDDKEEPVAEDRFDRGEGLLSRPRLPAEDLRPLRSRLLDRQVEVVGERPHARNVAGTLAASR
jgi:hypothetical protein